MLASACNTGRCYLSIWGRKDNSTLTQLWALCTIPTSQARCVVPIDATVPWSSGNNHSRIGIESHSTRSGTRNLVKMFEWLQALGWGTLLLMLCSGEIQLGWRLNIYVYILRQCRSRPLPEKPTYLLTCLLFIVVGGKLIQRLTASQSVENKW